MSGSRLYVGFHQGSEALTEPRPECAGPLASAILMRFP